MLIKISDTSLYTLFLKRVLSRRAKAAEVNVLAEGRNARSILSLNYRAKITKSKQNQISNGQRIKHLLHEGGKQFKD